MRIALLLSVAVALLSGCASSPQGVSFSPSTVSASNLATIYVYRLHTPPLLRKPDIEINGKAIAELPTETYTVIHLQPGAYEIKANWGFFDGPILNKSTKLIVASGATYYVEVSNNLNFIGTIGVYHSAVTGKELSEPPAAIRSCSLVPAVQLEIQSQ